MTTRKELKELIRSTEAPYNQCWEILSMMKTYKSGQSDKIERILDFQRILVGAVFKLENKFYSIAKEKNELIQNKERFATSWFQKKMKCLSGYQQVLDQAISLGRNLGDSYAWFFYQRDRKRLEEHLKYPAMKHIPQGVGGIGEVEFVSSTTVFAGFLVLYNGITNILRIGDVSLIDLSTFNLAGYGEVKSKKKGRNIVEVQVFMIGDRIDERFKTNVSSSNVRPKISERVKERLRKQLPRIRKSFDQMSSEEATRNLKINLDTCVSKMTDLFQILKTTKITTVKASDGLLLGGLSFRKGAFVSKFLAATRKTDYTNKMKDASKDVIQIVDKESKDNHLMICWLLYSRNNEATIIPGGIPMFWWPIRDDILRRIYFFDTLVFTLFNRLHLLKRLKTLGYEVIDQKDARETVLMKKANNAKIEIRRFDYFLDLVQICLYKESAVFEMVQKLISEIEVLRPKGNTKVNLSFVQSI